MPHHDYDSVRGRLRYLVEASGQKPKTLSRICGLSPAHVGMILRGDVARPDDATVSAIAAATKATRGWLAFGEGTAPLPAEVRAAVERARRARDPNTIADDAEAEEATGPVACPPIDVLEDPRPSMTGTDGR